MTEDLKAIQPPMHMGSPGVEYDSFGSLQLKLSSYLQGALDGLE